MSASPILPVPSTAIFRSLTAMKGSLTRPSGAADPDVPPAVGVGAGDEAGRPAAQQEHPRKPLPLAVGREELLGLDRLDPPAAQARHQLDRPRSPVSAWS